MLKLIPTALLCLAPSSLAAQSGSQIDDGRSVEDLIVSIKYGDASKEVLWTLFERNVRSDDVVQALEQCLRLGQGWDLSQVADTILNHWGIAHEVLSRQAYVENSSKLVEPDAAFPWLITPLELEDEELERLLNLPDPQLKMRAAFTLLNRDGRRIDVLRSILSLVPLVPLIQEFAGAAVGQAIGHELALAESDDERFGWVQILMKVKPAYRDDALAEVAALLDRQDDLGDEAQKVVLSTFGIRLVESREEGLHQYLAEPPLDEPFAQECLTSVVARLLEKSRASAAFDAKTFDLVLLCAARSYSARELAIPELLAELREAVADDRQMDALHLLRILCHLGEQDAFVRERYIETMSGWYKTHGEEFELLPCWKQHDAETLAAFDAVLTRAPRKIKLIDRLVFAGLFDSSAHDVTRRFIESLESDYESSWAWLMGRGFLHLSNPSPNDSKIRRVHKLSLSIAALKAHDKDFSEQASALAAILSAGYDEKGAGGYSDHYEWGFYHAIGLNLRGPEFVEAALGVLEGRGWPFSNHVEYAWTLLANAELTPEQARRMDAAPWKPEKSEDGWRGLSLLSPAQQDGETRRATLRDVPRLRRELYTGDTASLEPLLAITPLIARDEGYLLAQLERGNVHQRRAAMSLVEKYKLDFPTLRTAIAARTLDCDPRVREQAAHLKTSRGW